MIRAGEWVELERLLEGAVGECLPAVARKYKLGEHTVLGLWGELMAALAPAVYAAPDTGAIGQVAPENQPHHRADAATVTTCVTVRTPEAVSGNSHRQTRADGRPSCVVPRAIQAL